MKTSTHFLTAVLAVWLVAEGAMAAEAPADFNAANKLYAEGKFAAAATAYASMIEAGAVAPALYFNRGNAEFKSGNLGRAIAAYRRAALLAPRDAEVRANLDFVRGQVQGPTLRESRWVAWINTLTLNEWTAVAATALWLMFALLIAAQIRPALRTLLRSFTRTAVILVIVSATGAGVDAAMHFSSQTVVVIVPDATARSGPFDEAQGAFAAHNGAELSVLDGRDNWLQVTDGSGRIGWLPRRQVEVLPGS